MCCFDFIWLLLHCWGIQTEPIEDTKNTDNNNKRAANEQKKQRFVELLECDKLIGNAIKFQSVFKWNAMAIVNPSNCQTMCELDSQCSNDLIWLYLASCLMYLVVVKLFMKYFNLMDRIGQSELNTFQTKHCHYDLFDVWGERKELSIEMYRAREEKSDRFDFVDFLVSVNQSKYIETEYRQLK